MVFVYIVRCNFTDPAKEHWNAWYSGPKIEQMLANRIFSPASAFAWRRARVQLSGTLDRAVARGL